MVGALTLLNPDGLVGSPGEWKESASEHVRCVALGYPSQADVFLGKCGVL